MMEQGSLADLLTLAKSGDDNKLGEIQEKISGLERENAALTMQLSQNAQTRAIIEALSRTSTTTPAA
jgi:hypothetical protein